MGIVSMVERQGDTATAHSIGSLGQTLSACLKHSETQQPLTCWRAKDLSADLKSNEAQQPLTC